MSDLKYSKSGETEALKEAIREVNEAKKVIQTTLISVQV